MGEEQAGGGSGTGDSSHRLMGRFAKAGQAARALVVVTLVISLVAVLYQARQSARLTELKEQYMRSAARAADQVDGNLTSLFQVTRTMNGIFETEKDARNEGQAYIEALARDHDAEAEQESKNVNEKKSASEKAAAQLQRVAEEADELVQEETKKKNKLRGQLAEYTKRVEILKDAEEALAEFTRRVGFLEHANEALADAQTADAAAQQNLFKAELEANRSQAKSDAKKRQSGKKQPTKSTGDASDTATTKEGTNAGQGNAEQGNTTEETANNDEATALENTLAIHKEKLEEAEKEEDKKRIELEKKRADVSDAALAASQQMKLLQSAIVGLEGDERVLKLTAQSLEKAKLQYRASLTDVASVAADAKEEEGLREQERSALQERFGKSWRSSVLDSYSPAIRKACPHAMSEQESFPCVLREIGRLARVNFDFTPCPAGLKTSKVRREPIIYEGRLLSPLASGIACASQPFKKVFKKEVINMPSPGRKAAVGQVDQGFLLDAKGKVLLSAVESSPIRMNLLPREIGTPGDADISDLGRASIRRVHLGGQDYQAFIQPISTQFAQLEDGSESKELRSSGSPVVVLLVAQSRLLDESRQISPTVFMWVLFGLGLLILLFPLAKLWLVGPRASYGRFDAALFAFTGMLAALLAIVAGWSTYALIGLNGDLTDRLQHVHTQVETRLLRELDGGARGVNAFLKETEDDRKDLDKVRDDLIEWRGKQGSLAQFKASAAPPENCEFTIWRGYGGDRVEPVCERVGFDPPSAFKEESEARQPNPPSFAMGWTDSEGLQLAKYTTSEHATLPADLRGREYIEKALRNETQNLEYPAATDEKTGDSKKGESASEEETKLQAKDKENLESTPRDEITAKAAPEIVRSRTTGQYLLMFGAPLDPELPTGQKQEGVATLSTQLTSLSEAVLPENYSAILINNAGKVLYHSGTVPMHGYNVFDNIDDPDDLRAAIHARLHHESVDSGYLGVQTRMLIKPVPNTDWFLLVQAPTAGIAKMVSTMVTLSVGGHVLLMLMILVLAALLTWARVFLPKRLQTPVRKHRLLRPQFHLRHYYLFSGVTAVILATVLCFLSARIPECRGYYLLVAALATFAIPWLFTRWRPRQLRWLVAKLRSSESKKEGRYPDFITSFEIPYAVWLLGILSLWVGVPATVLFAGSYDHIVSNAVRAEQVHALDSFRENARPDEIEARAKQLEALKTCETEEPDAGSSTANPRFIAGSPETPIPKELWKNGPDCAANSGSQNSSDAGSAVATASMGRTMWTYLEKLTGPWEMPEIEDGSLSRPSLNSPDKKTESAAPISFMRTKTVSALYEDGTPVSANRIPRLLEPSKKEASKPAGRKERGNGLARIVLFYAVAALTAFAIGVAGIRRLFFTSALARQNSLPSPVPGNLPLPLGYNLGRPLLIRANAEDTAQSIQAKLSDFRFEEFHEKKEVVEEEKRDSLIPRSVRPWRRRDWRTALLVKDLNELCQSQNARRQLLQQIRRGRPVLLFSEEELNTTRWVRESKSSTWQSLRAWFDDLCLDMQLRGCQSIRGLTGQAVLAPARFIVHNPTEEILKTYRDEGFVELDSYDALISEGENRRVMVTSLNDLEADATGLERLQEIADDPTTSVVAFIDSGNTDRRIAYRERIPDALQPALLNFIEIWPEPQTVPSLRRFHTPSTSFLSKIWDESFEDERTVLVQVARSGYVTPHPSLSKVVEGLVSRGILDRDDLSMHPRLAAFVNDHADAHLQETESQTVKNDTWTTLRLPLATAIASVCAAFGISEPGIAAGGLLAPSVVAGVPAIFRVLLGMGGTEGGFDE